VYQRFGGAFCLHLQGCVLLYTGLTSEKTAFLIFTAMITSYITHSFWARWRNLEKRLLASKNPHLLRAHPASNLFCIPWNLTERAQEQGSVLSTHLQLVPHLIMLGHVISTPGVTTAWHSQFTCKKHDIWVAHMYTTV
jgi:hypothetical protein